MTSVTPFMSLAGGVALGLGVDPSLALAERIASHVPAGAPC